ncbi:MAG: hypothetical protein ACREOF_22075 [Gemmatimonadales bacterium]
MTGTRALLLLNPRARRGADAGADAAERLREPGLDLTVVEIRCPAGLTQLVPWHAPGLDRVLVIRVIDLGRVNDRFFTTASLMRRWGRLAIRTVQIVVPRILDLLCR